ncbi:hypothetical protein GWK47_003382 [Chionoecetes opilio]|uniref:Uncharacterized protein n=1 Tax=Chionoecetes opilio TaxID=41210 RepID=A0A8J5D310_CHIOP|nr:hypothetical protein GWK47_003382 [Chionoecetes opilio]
MTAEPHQSDSSVSVWLTGKALLPATLHTTATHLHGPLAAATHATLPIKDRLVGDKIYNYRLFLNNRSKDSTDKGGTENKYPSNPCVTEGHQLLQHHLDLLPISSSFAIPSVLLQ